MQAKIIPSKFTPERVQDGAFAVRLPEMYRLRDVVEMQEWHDRQNAFDHVVKSALALNDIVEFDYLPYYERVQLKAHLARTYDTCTRIGLLRIATLLHDIGKIVSFQSNANGNTSCPSHGAIGAWVAKAMVERFDLSEYERLYILDLICDHLVPSDLIEMSIKNKTPPQLVVSLLRTHRPGSVIELLILAYSDWMGCDVRDSVRGELDQRVAIAHELLSQEATNLQIPH